VSIQFVLYGYSLCFAWHSSFFGGFEYVLPYIHSLYLPSIHNDVKQKVGVASKCWICTKLRLFPHYTTFGVHAIRNDVCSIYGPHSIKFIDSILHDLTDNNSGDYFGSCGGAHHLQGMADICYRVEYFCI